MHIASLAGAWLALVAGFGGMRQRAGQPLRFAPRLRPGSVRLAFRMFFRGRLAKVEVTEGKARYTLLEGEPMDLATTARRSRCPSTSRCTHALPAVPDLAAPKQPPGRAPQPRRRS